MLENCTVNYSVDGDERLGHTGRVGFQFGCFGHGNEAEENTQKSRCLLRYYYTSQYPETDPTQRLGYH